RGRLHPWWLGSSLVPTFHPAAALRGGDRVTDQMRSDFALVRSILDGLEQESPTAEETVVPDPSQMELFG
ncbi:MAG TPA: hypothetical protein VI689_04035, partial [Acidimicrobiia bacterium]|nr:hypothetical protein [Acidimicrobiia bacterium]